MERKRREKMITNLNLFTSVLLKTDCKNTRERGGLFFFINLMVALKDA